MTIRLPDLVGRLRLETRDLERAKGDVKNFAKSLDGIGKGVGSSLGAGLDQVTTRLTSRLGPAGAQVKATLDSIGVSALASGDALKLGPTVAAVGAGLALTKFATDGVKAFTSVTGEIRQFQRVSGASAEDASKFVAAIKVLGIEPAAVAKNFGLLAKNIETNQKGFQRYGIEVARNKDGTRSLEGTLFNVADAFNAAKDKTDQLNTARAAFGRGFEQLLPVLARGRDGIKELFAAAEAHGLVFTQQDLDNAREFSLATKEFHEAIQGLEIVGGKALVPFLTTATKVADKLVTITTQLERIPGVAKFLARLPSEVATHLAGPVGSGLRAGLSVLPDPTKDKKAADDAAASIDGLSESFDGLGGSTDSATAAQGDFVGSTKKIKDVLDVVNKATDDRHRAVLSVLDAEAANRAAISTFASAADDVADKERALADARRKRGDATRDAISVERDLLSVEDAKSSVADKERELADARAGRGPKARELADAEKALGKAREEADGAHGIKALGEATDRVGEAEERLRRAREDGGQVRDVADATEAMTRAQLEARSAALDLADAKEAGARREKEAEQALFTSRENAKAAAIGAARAAQDLAREQAAANNQPFTVSDGYRVFRDKLIEIKDGAVGPLRTELEGLVNEVGALPAEKKITFRVPGLEEAISLVDRFATTIGGIKSDIAFIASLPAGGLPTLAAPPPPAIAALTGASGRAPTTGPLAGLAPTSTTTNINTTVVAPGVNADVAREIDKRTARAAARAR